MPAHQNTQTPTPGRHTKQTCLGESWLLASPVSWTVLQPAEMPGDCVLPPAEMPGDSIALLLAAIAAMPNVYA